MDPSFLAEMIPILESFTALRYTFLAPIFLQFYDQALMFPQEVEYVWRRKITLPLVFYLILRYFSPGLGVFLLATSFKPNLLLNGCRGLMIVPVAYEIFQAVIVGAIMIMRTYALYERNFIILGGLAMLLVGQLVIMSVMEILEARRQIALAKGPLGCLAALEAEASQVDYMTVFWCMPLTVDTAVFALTFYKLYKLRIELPREYPLLSLIARDGLLYYGVIFMLNFTNAMVFLLAGPFLKPILANLCVVMSSILACRVVLNLQMVTRHGGTQDVSTDIELGEFTPGPFYNSSNSNKSRNCWKGEIRSMPQDILEIDIDTM